MKNIKDIATNIAGVLIAFGGFVMSLQKADVVIPKELATAGIISGVLGAVIIAYFTGKNPDGSSKTKAQVAAQNEQAQK